MSSVVTTSSMQDVSEARTSPASASPASQQASCNAPVLLATEGFGASRSPAIVAHHLARRLNCPLRVVSVIEPVIVYAGTRGLMPVPTMIDQSYAWTREESVHNALGMTLPAGAQYDVETRFGAVMREIASEAREVAASIVVVGAAPHRRRKHVLSGVLASQVLRNVRCPVLSVAPGLDHLPRQVLVATDFSDASIRAAREALRLMDDSGTLTLAHAIPIIDAERMSPTLAGVLEPVEATRLLEQLRSHLQRLTPTRCKIELRVLDGSADDSLLALATALEADLIAVGTHGPGALERVFIGSTAANILHLASCSVLAVQAPGVAERIELDLEAWGTAETYDDHQWGKLLDAFTRRNTGCRVRVQVDDLAFGAQLQAAGYTFRGATFDTRDKRVNLMLGAPEGSDAHLTRSISGVISVAMSRDSSGLDIALQIRSDTSETLVIFE